jgi:hypothetical protein
MADMNPTLPLVAIHEPTSITNGKFTFILTFRINHRIKVYITKPAPFERQCDKRQQMLTLSIGTVMQPQKY